ncbi:hypothetical protein pEaSNUABM14_00336 [Erwinia phage pEa_SNUABM_14]|uniref:Uncharacterized protein n=1 Tax=Erwinia phage pEa_SNUABM_7 TaxID=2866695 RepID=A0AAE8BLL7_9CAUD|nr:hypothetical protein MPK74_gp339 [Erwinia phage pEa_SNUABM_7]QYW04661.1 hypothetical protein pEaSNUABM14_00336 [Erwinia phage pEa_SNUABM_14]QYW05007.1 hypothetical protein pEaSNUABM7_00339 [Erwinia phage pEa_SNUABM_7]
MLKGKKVNQAPSRAARIFPVVAGTEHWHIPLFDMPDIHINMSEEQKARLDSAMANVKQHIKDSPYNGKRFFTMPGDAHE